MVSITSDTLFNAAAAVVGTAAALLFVLGFRYPYSPVSKYALALVFLVGVLALCQRTTDSQVTLFGYGVVLAVLVAVFFDVAETFDAGTPVVIAGLLLLSALLYAVPRFDAADRLLAPSHARTLFAGVAALAALLLVVDVATGGLVYELRPASQVEFDGGYHGGNDVDVATLRVSNPTPFPERVEAPRYGVCAVGNWTPYRPPGEPKRSDGEVYLNAYVDDGYNDHVFGGSERTYRVALNTNAANLTGETIPVERTASCPNTDAGPPSVALFPDPSDR
ncbi:hypothetical protein NDI76_16605 [Halogeometricum sp. S1BR25-6]|uniref:DUF1616 domain-containing protein n=1 Tax=Halogeometricum salsisoli TaxID=2950536 RepID=A0ABU2GJK3_9EURY|nr:hypothetical protein [Halogeometricum sp. S1BR25-6]MDS0300369.1 hypothetical protein [Halogeometricum sp. S1BR25-6]